MTKNEHMMENKKGHLIALETYKPAITYTKIWLNS